MDDARQRGEVCLRRPSGLRRLTAGGVAADRTAEAFSGLPEGITNPSQVLAALKAAAPFIGLAPRFVHAVDFLFRFTQLEDWQPDSRPIVWPSSALQQLELGLSETQVKALNRALIELGLITARDSPNGKRYGRRNGRGKIIEAYGFDLSPLAARYAEFVAVAEAGRAEREAIRRLRRRVTIARKAIQQITETVAEYGLVAPEMDEHAAAARALTAAARDEETEAGLAEVVTLIERRREAAFAWLNSELNSVKTDPKPAEYRLHKTTTTDPQNLDRDTVFAHRGSSRGGEGGASDPSSEPVIDPCGVGRTQPTELIELAPSLRPYLSNPRPTWPEILDATEWLRHDLDVSLSLWGRACQAMGRVPAAIALALVSTKPRDEIRTTPAGYFHGMVTKAERGDLHLDRTLWKLRKTRQAGSPGRQPHAMV